jgi:hypothetical protein
MKNIIFLIDTIVKILADNSPKQNNVMQGVSRQTTDNMIKVELPRQREVFSSMNEYQTVQTSNAVFPKYLSLEPSLAIDWLEISWDELELKERVGAGILLSLSLLLTHMSPHTHPLLSDIHPFCCDIRFFWYCLSR